MSNPAYSSASLYVGDLAPEVNDTYLFELFKDVGPIQSIRVCKDALTFCSLGYAYVNFHNAADAEQAIEQFNNTMIMSKQCRIMWSHRDPSKRRSGVGNVFIKNLDASINNSSLYETFSTFGHILSCKVEVDQQGGSKGYGFVHFETKEEADLAVAKVNGMLLNGKQVFVGPFLPKKDRINTTLSNDFTNVFIKNLDLSVTSQELRDRFAKFGTVTSAVVMTNERGESKGFGFVNFESADDAANAAGALNNIQWGNKVVFVGRAQKKRERQEQLKLLKNDQASKFHGANIYIKNLDDNVDDDRLRTEFAKFGTISSAKIMRDDKGNSKGFGFVCFSSSDEATRAVTEMNATLIGSKPLYVGLAQRKDARKAQLEALYNQRTAGNMRMMQPNPMVPMYPGEPSPMFMQQMMPPRMMFPPHPGMMPPNMRPRQTFGGMPNYVNQVVQHRPMQPRQQQPPQQQPQQQQRGPRKQAPYVGNGTMPSQLNHSGNSPQDQARGFKFTASARNQIPANPPNFPAVQQPPFAQPDHLEAMMGTEESKQMVGEQLFPHVARVHPTLAPKITGMLLESLELRELLGLLQSKPMFDQKIGEAIDVLRQHEQAIDVNPNESKVE